ncbi:hypothetical protein CARUB_v10005849mg [Capsella rubella]|uniref:Cystatin domain-containing protein n=1 Tax=Capsella rubella TaxID=81985 RepID=R0F7J2_9BRAS|nr:uncharacterized protein LOC17879395 [Capsella rubella]XP_023635392.1 uncharacterized protein LOC17879395 [Capsella rubella]EOA17516.1 hypothetical protein CARUB_v10005849mg [Capsella rubella]
MPGVDDSKVRLRDPAEIESPERKIETKSEDRPPNSFYFGGKLLRVGEPNDEECFRQAKLFSKQFGDSEGFDVDWDSFDYVFSVVNFYWQPQLDDRMTNDELLKQLIRAAIEEYDDDNGTELELIDYVGANMAPCKGIMYYITFRAKDVSSTNPELYQAKVRKFCDDIAVKLVREKPHKEIS